MAGRHRDRGRLDFAVCGNQLVDRTKTTAAEYARHFISLRGVRIHDSDQSDWRALLRKLVVDACMVAAKYTDADYGNVDEVVSQFSVLSWPVARRPVDLTTKNCRWVSRCRCCALKNRIIETALFSAKRSGPHDKARAGRCR